MDAPRCENLLQERPLKLRQGEVPLLGHATVGEVCAHACAYATLSAQLAQAPPRKRRSFDWDRDAETRGIEACVGLGEGGTGATARLLTE